MAMKGNWVSIGLWIAVASVAYGCAQHATDGPRTSRYGKGSNPHCEWDSELDPATGKVKTGTFTVKQRVGMGPCARHETSALYVWGPTAPAPAPMPPMPPPGTLHKVERIGAIEFVTSGSCRVCYINTSGGMSCVTYPGPPC